MNGYTSSSGAFKLDAQGNWVPNTNYNKYTGLSAALASQPSSTPLVLKDYSSGSLFDEDSFDWSSEPSFDFSKANNSSSNWWDSFVGERGIKTTDADGNTSYTGGSGLLGTLGDSDFMSGLSQIGSLGLGLASYFQQKPLYEAQLESAKAQNAAFKEDRDALRTARNSWTTGASRVG